MIWYANMYRTSPLDADILNKNYYGEVGSLKMVLYKSHMNRIPTSHSYYNVFVYRQAYGIHAADGAEFVVASEKGTNSKSMIHV